MPLQRVFPGQAVVAAQRGEGIVAMYADDIRVSRLRRNGLPAPDDPDLGRPSH